MEQKTTYGKSARHRAKNIDRLQIRLASFLFLCFIFYQFGPSYHLSFGSVGLFILVAIFINKATKKTASIAAMVAASMFLSYALYILRYGYDGDFLKIARFIVNAAALFLIINRQRSLSPPPTKLIAVAIMTLVLLAIYQNFVDINVRPPANWFALHGAIDQGAADYVHVQTSLRVSGPYTEPSVLGLVFCCLFAFCLRFDGKGRVLFSSLCIIGVLISGSLLGLIGLIALYLCAVKSGIISGRLASVNLVLAISVILIAISLSGLELAIFDRSYSTGGELDDSTMTRLVYPFVLIGKIFYELNLLGFPGDIYNHFLYTGMYDSAGNFPGHNGFLGVVMAFGLFGIAAIWALFRQLVGHEEAILVVLIGSQSGNFYSYEKIFLILYVIMALRGMRTFSSRSIGQQMRVGIDS